MKKTLALVMVVKDEEKGIERAILSARPHVDEVWVCVDNKSSDKTLEIAKRLATHVEQYEFKNNFSLARNYAHRNVETDWIMFLDGHEYIEKCERLQEYLNLDCDGLLTTIKMENDTEFRNPRIYKNGVQFTGAIHERSQCEKTALCSGVVIKHNRTKGQTLSGSEFREKQRNYQMSTLMLNEYKENPKDLRVIFHLALWYQTQHDFKKAKKFQNLFLKFSPAQSDRYFILYNKAMLHFEKSNLFRAFLSINRAGWEEEGRWETDKLKGVILFARGKYEKALTHLVDSFNNNKRDFAYKPLKRDDAGTWNLIGECFYRRGVYDKASTAFRLASQRAESDEQKKFFASRADLMNDMIKGR